MKKLLFCTLAALLLSNYAGIVGDAFAQNARIHHRITTAKHDAPQLGRDCWFTLMDMGQGASGAYYALYITSPNITTAYIHLTGGITSKVTVQPYQSVVFNIPLSWGMTSSGKIESKGIHVWSNDADLSCYVMSHSPYSSDGMYLLPTIGWGKEYVVAGYGALFESFSSDYPSEFAIVANQNGTHINITPSADLRVETTTGSCCSCVAASKGTPFQITLDAGQSVQYKTTCVQDCDNFDVTGTVITSDKNIGVVAGSMCTNIPCNYPYCDHLCEMMPPTRTWGNTYYSLPFYQPPGMPPAHTQSTFLVITTKPGQIIQRYDNSTGQDVPYFLSSKKYDTYWRNDVDQGSRWHSDTSFLVVQYINSSSYPDNQNGQGDPSEVILQPVEGYAKSVVFQTPAGIGNQTKYTNYVNIIAKPSDKHVKMDGQSVIGLHGVYIDGIYSGYRASNVPPEGKIVTSDSGVSVYVYGYGYDESFAWPGPLGTATVNSRDTTPPLADTSGQCFSAHVTFADMDGDTGSLGINYVRVDSNQNMTYLRDTSRIDGTPKTRSVYDMTVADITKPAILIISAFDQAGNRTTVTSSYTPQTAHIGPPEQDFGVGNPTNCIYMYDTLVNTGKVPFPFTDLHLVLGDQGFSIDSAVAKPLAVGEVRKIKLCFVSVKGSTVYDTIRFGDPCMTQDVLLIGTGGLPDFRVTGHDLGTVLLGQSITLPASSGVIEAVNMSPTQPITVDSMWVDDPVHFVPTKDANWVAGRKPDTLAPKGTIGVTFTFRTIAPFDAVGHYETKWYAYSKQLVGPGETGIRFNILKADVVAPGVSFTADTTDTLGCPRPNNDSVGQQFVLTTTGNATSVIKSIVHTNAYFRYFTVTRDNGSVVANPTSMSEQLQPGQSLFITESFIAVQSMGGIYQDSIYASSLNQADGTTQMIGAHPLIATMIVSKCSEDVQPTPRGAALPACASLMQVGAGLLRIVTPADWSAPTRVEIETVLGARVLDALADGNTIDASTLATGVYFYRLSSRGTGILPVTGKIIIQR